MPNDTSPVVALIRAINVGGRGRVPMPALREAIVALGCRDVRTYIQSGNVVLRAPAALGSGQVLGRHLAGAVLAASGVEAAVIVRTADELAALVAGCPFPSPEADPTRHFATFLEEAPTPAAAAAASTLGADRSPPDALVVAGADVYLRLPNGAAETRLTNAWLERALGTRCTARNWRTVLALLALAQEAER